MDTCTHELVRVGAVFEKDSFTPVWFGFAGHKVKIETVHYRWTERRSGELLYKFTVSDNIDTYELEFSSRNMQWYLTAY